jgi:hydroxymethylbilane synthase
MASGNEIRIGARGSKLSLQQTESVRTRLAQAYPDRAFTIVPITTKGDLTLDTPLPEIGGKGLFTLEIEQALRLGAIDLAVHSLKDLPTDPVPDIVIGAIPERADVADAVISRSGAPLLGLPEGAVIGTSSHRRAAQLRRMRPDFQPASIRGNVETRMRKTLDPAGPYDATVLAAAGLDRLGLLSAAVERLPLEAMLPAPGQGALAVQCRDDEQSRALLSAIDDRAARFATSAERAFLSGVGGGCSAPIACYGELTGNRLTLHGRVVALDAARQVDVHLERDVFDEAGAIAAGALLAVEALHNGAAELLSMTV